MIDIYKENMKPSFQCSVFVGLFPRRNKSLPPYFCTNCFHIQKENKNSAVPIGNRNFISHISAI